MTSIMHRRLPLALALAVTISLIVVSGGVVGSAAAAGPNYINDVSYHSGASLNDSETTKSASAACPGGDHLLGGGALITEEGHRVALLADQPNATDDAWQATAAETRSTEETWQVTAVAICADTSAPTTESDYVGYFGYSYLGSSPKNSQAEKSGSVPDSCLPDQILGGGASVYGDAQGVALTGTFPDGGQDRDAWGGAAAEMRSTDGKWKLTLVANCAEIDLPAIGPGDFYGSDISYPIKSSATSSKSQRSVTAKCAGPDFLFAGGGAVTGGGAAVMLTRAGQLTDGERELTAKAAEIRPTSSQWSVSAYGICVDDFAPPPGGH